MWMLSIYALCRSNSACIRQIDGQTWQIANISPRILDKDMDGIHGSIALNKGLATKFMTLGIRVYHFAI